MTKLEITLDVIIHATEDASKCLDVFEALLGLNEKEFTIRHTTGHFGNPITILNVKLVKNRAIEFVEKLIGLLSEDQIAKMIGEIEERTVDSKYHLRISKQDLINGKITFQEKDPIKLKIFTPVYNKKRTVDTFSNVFKCQLN